MAKLPKQTKSRLDIFVNDFKPNMFNPRQSENDEMFTTKGRLVARFHIDHKDNGKMFQSDAKVWRRFDANKTIASGMNQVLKAAALELEGTKKWDITEKQSLSIRRSHSSWLVRCMKINEIETSWHSALTKNGVPCGFISITERDGKWVGFVTQCLDPNSKHAINIPTITSQCTVMFRREEYDDMVNVYNLLNN